MKRPHTQQVTLDRALSAAQSALGSQEDVARLRTRLAAAVSAELPSPGMTPQHKPSPLSAARIWLVSGAALIATATWLGARTPTTDPRPQPPSAAAEPTPAPPPAAELAPVPVPVPVPAPPNPKAAETKPAPRRTAKPTRTPAPQATPPITSEVQLISQAQATLERDPRAALGFLSQHEQQYQQGMLREERDILRFDAERALHMTERARAHALAFIRAYPSSPHRRRVEQWLSETSSQEPASATTHPVQ
jgi:outer membrane biosynthesis protein TonB